MSDKPPPGPGHDPELAEALSKLSEGLKEGEDPFFYDWRAKPRPQSISSGGVDQARAYVPPTTLPPTVAHKTFEMERVKVSPRFDPRRAPTSPRLDPRAFSPIPPSSRTSETSSVAPPASNAVTATPEPFLPAVSPPPGAVHPNIDEMPTPVPMPAVVPPLVPPGGKTPPMGALPIPAPAESNDVAMEMPIADWDAHTSPPPIPPSPPRSVTPIVGDADTRKTRSVVAVLGGAAAVGGLLAVLVVMLRPAKTPTDAGVYAATPTTAEATAVTAATSKAAPDRATPTASARASDSGNRRAAKPRAASPAPASSSGR